MSTTLLKNAPTTGGNVTIKIAIVITTIPEKGATTKILITLGRRGLWGIATFAPNCNVGTSTKDTKTAMNMNKNKLPS